MLPRFDHPTTLTHNHRNILEIAINKNNELLVRKELLNLGELKALAVSFIDNGGAPSKNKEFCDYCEGGRDPKLSDNPARAIISLTSHREAKYGFYIAVQNELVGAYNELRNREALRLYRSNFSEMQAIFENPETSEKKRILLKERIKHIQGLFPMNLSEASVE
jgi:hypothetical protein